MIVVVGESLVDVSPDGVETVGGSPLNVATALGRLEVPVALFTEIGDDERGARIARHLHDSEVELVAVPAGRTGTARVRFDADGEPAYELDLGWSLPHQQLPACDALHVGSLGTVLEPGRTSVLDLVEQAWALDVVVSYDPNVRAPSLAEPESAWRDVEALADRAHLVRLSEQDVALLLPGADPEDVARSLLTGERTELVVLTRGAEGPVAFTDGLVVAVPAVPVEVADTVGAGDAFTAGLLTVLLESQALGGYGSGLPRTQGALEQLLGAAAEVAAFSCARQGAAAPRRHDLRPGWPSFSPA